MSDGPPLGGRCFVSPYSSEYSGTVAVYEKGIFIDFEHSPFTFGVVESNATNAARERHAQLSIYGDREWINSVRSKSFASCRNIGEQIAVQKIFLLLDQPDPNYPLFLRNREFISQSELFRQLARDGAFVTRLVEDNDNVFKWKAAHKLSSLIGLDVDERRVYPLADFAGEVESKSDFSMIVDRSDEALFRFLRQVRDMFGKGAEVLFEHHEREGYHNDYIDVRITPGTVP